MRNSAYSNQKIIIPGDIESPGWNALLEKEDFLEAIKGTTIFIASHHGRESGFSEDLFKYFRPDITIISDRRGSDTSATDRYHYYSKGARVKSRSSGEEETRYVLTTREDGAIYIEIEYNDASRTTKRTITID